MERCYVLKITKPLIYKMCHQRLSNLRVLSGGNFLWTYELIFFQKYQKSARSRNIRFKDGAWRYLRGNRYLCKQESVNVLLAAGLWSLFDRAFNSWFSRHTIVTQENSSRNHQLFIDNVCRVGLALTPWLTQLLNFASRDHCSWCQFSGATCYLGGTSRVPTRSGSVPVKVCQQCVNYLSDIVTSSRVACYADDTKVLKADRLNKWLPLPCSSRHHSSTRLTHDKL